MSWRIRAYLAVVAFRNLGTAYTLHRDGDLYERSDLFRYVFELAPVSVWLWIMVAMGLGAIGGVLWPRETGIRVLVAASVGITFAWAAGFVAAELVLGTRSTIATVLFVALALKDLIVSGMSFENPLEAMVRRDELDELEEEERRARLELLERFRRRDLGP